MLIRNKVAVFIPLLAPAVLVLRWGGGRRGTVLGIPALEQPALEARDEGIFGVDVSREQGRFKERVIKVGVGVTSVESEDFVFVHAPWIGGSRVELAEDHGKGGKRKKESLGQVHFFVLEVSVLAIGMKIGDVTGISSAELRSIQRIGDVQERFIYLSNVYCCRAWLVNYGYWKRQHY